MKEKRKMENRAGLADRARYEAFSQQWWDAALKEAERRCSREDARPLLAAAVLTDLRKKYAYTTPPSNMDYDIREKTNAVFRLTGQNPLLLEYYLESHAFLDTSAAEKPAPKPAAEKPAPEPAAEIPAPEIPAEETMSENASERVPDTFLDPVRTTLWTPDSERSRHVVQEIVLPDEDEELPRSEKLSFVNAVLFLLVMASFLFCFFETGFLQYLLS